MLLKKQNMENNKNFLLIIINFLLRCEYSLILLRTFVIVVAKMGHRRKAIKSECYI